MAKYIAKRVALAIVTLLVLTSVVFVLVRLMPGDPFMSEKASEENRAILIAKYGLDQPDDTGDQSESGSLLWFG